MEIPHPCEPGEILYDRERFKPVCSQRHCIGDASMYIATTILIAIYSAAFVAMTVITILNYEDNPDGNIPLTILAHVFWPVTLCAFMIWLSVKARSRRL
jgi:hypothetical protein